MWTKRRAAVETNAFWYSAVFGVRSGLRQAVCFLVNSAAPSRDCSARTALHLAASIGIVKGKKFSPDARMQRVLTDAVAVGNATARTISFRDRVPRAAIYPNSQWQTMFGAADYRWLDKEAEGARNLDARPKFFYGYTVNTPKMEAKSSARLTVRHRFRRLVRGAVRRH